MRHANRSKVSFWGTLFIVVGTLLLLSNFQILPVFLSSVFLSWQMLLIVLGLYQSVWHRSIFSGGVLITIGVYFLLKEHFPEYNITSQALLGAAILALGAHILFRKSPGKKRVQATEFGEIPAQPDDEDVVDISVIIGSAKRSYHSCKLRGGEVTCVMGETIIDLSAAELSGGSANLEVFVLMGSLEIFVPRTWNVSIEVKPVLGAITEERQREFVVPEKQESRLTVRGSVIMGGGIIRYR